MELAVQHWQSLGQGVGDQGRQSIPQVSEAHARPVGAAMLEMVRAGEASEEVPHPLGRRLIPRAAKGVGFLLP